MHIFECRILELYSIYIAWTFSKKRLRFSKKLTWFLHYTWCLYFVSLLWIPRNVVWQMSWHDKCQNLSAGKSRPFVFKEKQNVISHKSYYQEPIVISLTVNNYIPIDNGYRLPIFYSVSLFFHSQRRAIECLLWYLQRNNCYIDGFMLERCNSSALAHS